MNGFSTQLRTVSDDTAIASEGVSSPDASSQGRGEELDVEGLARQTGRGPSSDLQRIVSLKSRDIELLMAAGVVSVANLAKNDPNKLVAWLREVNSEARVVRSLPKLDQVVAWINAARELCRAA